MAKKKTYGPTKSKAQMDAASAAEFNKAIDNTALTAALDRLKEQPTKANETDVFELLKEALVLMPVLLEEAPKNVGGKVILPKQFRFPMMTLRDKRSFIPIFTGIEEAQKIPAPTGDMKFTYVGRTLKDIEKMLKKESGKCAGVILNPRKHDIILTPEIIGTILHGEERRAAQEEMMKKGVLPAGMQVSYFEPEIYPTAIANAIYEVCRGKETVSRVWLKGMRTADASGFAVMIEADDDSMNETIREAANTAAKETPVMVMKVTDQLMKNVIKDDVAVYDREMEF